MIQSQPPIHSQKIYDDAQRWGVGVNVCVVWLHAMMTQSLRGACGTAAACSCSMDPALASDWLPAPKYPPRLNTLSNELCRGAVRLALVIHNGLHLVLRLFRCFRPLHSAAGSA